MGLIINGEKINDSLINNEIQRLSPDYRATFTEQSPEEQDAQIKEWAKENIIEQILIQQAAKKDFNIKISNDVINKKLLEMIEEHGGKDKFYEQFDLSQSDENKIKDDIQLQLEVDTLLSNICKDIIGPNEAEIKQYFDNHQSTFISPEQVRVAHIVKHVNVTSEESKAKEEIQKIYEELKSGKSFETLANENSDCPGSSGDLGYFPRGQMVQKFEDIVFSMKNNQISDIFQTEFGFHIAKVYDRVPEQILEYKLVKEEIKEQLLEEKKNKEIEDFIDSLREKADITYYEDLPKDFPGLKQNKKNNKASSQPRKQLNSVLIKPAGPDCNMDCSYCFYLKKESLFTDSKIHRMSEDTLEKMISQILTNSGTNVSFGWQGGEPTLMGLEFFEKVIELQRKYGQGKTIGNGLQTNGVLIDKKWAEFLKKNNFLVGLSLDGPEHIHDHYRTMQNGKGSWERVVENGKLMLDAGVAVNALSVINDYSSKFPKEIYDFHKEFGIEYQQYIPCLEVNPHNASEIAPFSVSPENYGKLLCTIFDLWIADFKDNKPTTSIRYFDSLFHYYVDLMPPECTLLPSCGIYTVVEHNGDIYSCDFFVDPEWKLGNIHNDNILELLNSEKQNKFGQLKADLPETCKKCKWLRLCRGGCIKEREHHSNYKKLNYFCESFKMFFEHSDKQMQQIADDWKGEQVLMNKQKEVVTAIKNGKLKVDRNDTCPCGSGKKFKKCCGLEI